MHDELLLYDLTDSPFCLKARICLQLKGLAYRRVTLTVRRRRELKRVSPLGKVPVLVDQNRAVADSSAIARYLEERCPEPALLPSDRAARAYCSLVEDWADESLYFVVGAFKWLNPENRTTAVERTVSELDSGLFAPLVARLVARQVTGRYRAWRYTGATLPYFVDRMHESLAWLDALLADRAFLLGRTLTLADVAVYAQLAWMRNYAEARLVAGAPAVAAWLARLDDIPAVADALTT